MEPYHYCIFLIICGTLNHSLEGAREIFFQSFIRCCEIFYAIFMEHLHEIYHIITALINGEQFLL